MSTRVIEDQTFRGWRDRNSGSVYRDYSFHRCRFEACMFGSCRAPAERPTAKQISLRDCAVSRCVVTAPILDEVRVESLQSDGNLILWAPALRHVMLAGDMGGLIINPDEDPAGDAEPANVQIREANARFYSQIDWALDIRHAAFRDVSIRGVPAKLIRRDATCQVVIRREKVLGSRWKELPLDGTHWAGEIEWFLDRSEADHVLVAPRRAPNFARLVEGLRVLQAAGLADEG